MPVEPRIAIVGMGGVFPGAPTPKQLWDRVVAAADNARNVPAGRWLLDPVEVFDAAIGRLDRVYSCRGCFIENLPPLPEGIDLPGDPDPVFLLTLEAGRQAFAAANTDRLDRGRVGVILGNIALPTESASALARAWLGRTFAEKMGIQAPPCPFDSPPPYGTSLPAAVLANALGLGGSSFTMDAACASSLYALKLAADELRAGRADAILAGGVSRPDCLYTQMGFSQLRALSPSGTCRPFDAAADGLVVGEGAGIFLLKRLDDALRDGDRILAVLAGVGLSNDLGGGLLAPGGDGQLRAMREAYRQAGWSPTDVDLIECHATGTPVGDAVEFRSMRSLWEGEPWQPGQCVIGSVKSTVGHLLTAAGAAAVAKVLGALHEAVLPPTANFRIPARALNYEGSPFRVLTEPRPWPRRNDGVPRRVAVSGFGFGGINAHVLLEEWLPPARAPSATFVVRTPPAPPVAIVAAAACFGPWTSLRSFEERVLGRGMPVSPQPPRHWWGVEQSEWFRTEGLRPDAFAGYYLDGPLKVPAKRFRIPPRELEEMLPQQALMLEVAADAWERVGVLEEHRQRAGVFIGLGIDLNTTNFHFRWSVIRQARAEAARRGLDSARADAYVQAIADAAGPPLTANRTMGALGSIVASRIAREFRLGGPSFTLCGEDTSGLRALEAAVRALQQGEVDQALVGAVDLAGDVRPVLARRTKVPGEGAAAVVLKRLDDAIAEGDTVLAIVKGIGSASEGVCEEALQRACREAGVEPDCVDNVGAASSEIGDAGAAAGLAALVKASLALHQQSLPPHAELADAAALSSGPRRRAITSCGGGTCMQVVLEAAETAACPAADDPGQARKHTGPGVSIPIGGRPFEIPEWTLFKERERQPAQDGLAMAAGLAPRITRAAEVRQATAEAHSAYLRFSEALTAGAADTLTFQTAILEACVKSNQKMEQPRRQPVFLDRAACLEFATGSIGRVLGAEFAVVDSHPTRVRLPDEPLMLVDRILAVEGQPRSLTGGRVVTEHDVLPGAWYLDGGRIPTCVAVEAGQADLFLSAYLGIDFQTRGHAVYRLLDAAVTFHRPLPGPGQTIHYDIHIDRFFRQGQTRLFRFRFAGTVGGAPLLTMTDGCAGFFTTEELAAGKGVVQTASRRPARPGVRAPGEDALAPMASASYTAAQVEALRAGDLASAFGPTFAGLTLAPSLRLPGGRMNLVDRVVELDPHGGRFGIGLIRAEADIHPDDWFLTCHFVDDRVMPGTLMYECCLHTLRIFLLRLGWVAPEGEPACEPIPGVTSRLKCRGQVTAATRTVTYEVTFKERGYRPEPYAIADALMYADGKPIVQITDMSVRLSGLNRAAVESLWARRRLLPSPPLRGRGEGGEGASLPHETNPLTPDPSPRQTAEWGAKAPFPRESILAFAVGKPSDAFGEPYRIFDEQRFIARLPGPPFSFLDRIVRVEAEPWKMVAGGVAHAEYDVTPDAWYFATERQPYMPFAVLQEVALQACGWLAAYVGSALTSPEGLSFRNLGGEAVLHAGVGPDAGTLSTRARLTQVASLAGMILQQYIFEVRNSEWPVYSGTTSFGFFTKAALAQQVGIRDERPYEPGTGECNRREAFPFPREAPLPDDRLRMLDRVHLFLPDGGPHGLGFLQGSKDINPQEWFFKAHFLQDPVWPGSLGLESFLQLLKVAACRSWGVGLRFRLETGRAHRWLYRGQVIPDSRRVVVQACVSDRADTPAGGRLTANGTLAVDGRLIYKMSDFTLIADRWEGQP
jgi:3-oxoacyl-(acyl-carrier-protein) synthase/3-hydroxymyristoyl/3-hydroxydecanoyl-(acyl carrier protein) dehydratase